MVRREEARKEVTKLLDVVLETAWWRYSVEEVWNKLEYNKELQRIIQWRIGNQRLDERMMIAFQDRQERIQRRDEAKQRWRARNALRMEPMELGGGQGDWWDTEFHEHEAINSMMVNLGIYDDMEIGEDHKSIIDESFGLEVDEALEHAFLDRMLEGIDDLKMEVSDDGDDMLMKVNLGSTITKAVEHFHSLLIGKTQFKLFTSTFTHGRLL